MIDYELLLTNKNISEILDMPISWHSFSTRLTNALMYGMNARSESRIYDFTTCTLRDVLLRIIDIGEIAFVNDCKRIGKKTFREFMLYLNSIVLSGRENAFCKDPTMKDVFDTMNEDQKNLLYAMVEASKQKILYEIECGELVRKKEVMRAVYKALREPSNNGTWLRIKNAINNIEPINN